MCPTPGGRRAGWPLRLEIPRQQWGGLGGGWGTFLPPPAWLSLPGLPFQIACGKSELRMVTLELTDNALTFRQPEKPKSGLQSQSLVEVKTRSFGLGGLRASRPCCSDLWQHMALFTPLGDAADAHPRRGTQQRADGRCAHVPGAHAEVSSQGGVSGTEGAARIPGWRAGWAGKGRPSPRKGPGPRLQEAAGGGCGPAAATGRGSKGRKPRPAALRPWKPPQRDGNAAPRPEHTAHPERPECPPMSGGQQNTQTRRDLVSEEGSASKKLHEEGLENMPGRGGPDLRSVQPSCRGRLPRGGEGRQVPTAFLPTPSL